MSDSNRMGYRLKGPQITHRDTPIVVSEATPLGAVQVPGQGNPVILLRERGTTGGYTKIACVIRKDLDILGQILPGEGDFFSSCGSFRGSPSGSGTLGSFGVGERPDKIWWENSKRDLGVRCYPDRGIENILMNEEDRP